MTGMRGAGVGSLGGLLGGSYQQAAYGQAGSYQDYAQALEMQRLIAQSAAALWDESDNPVLLLLDAA